MRGILKLAIKYSEIEKNYDREKTKNLKKMVFLRLATLNYEIKNDEIRVKIIISLEEDKIEVEEVIISDKDLNNKEINTVRGSFLDIKIENGKEQYLGEPIINHFDLLPQEKVSNLIERLEKYKEKLEYVENKEELFIKQIHNENKRLERNECGRIWINYEKQYPEKGYIYNIDGGAGIWATYVKNYKYVYDNIETYGNKIFILKQFNDTKYIKLNEEIIGNKFKVEKIYDISEYNEKEFFEKLIKDSYLTSKTEGISKFIRLDIREEEEKNKKDMKLNKKNFFSKLLEKFKR